MTKSRWLVALWVCLQITRSDVGWADPAHPDWVDSPFAPHVTDGNTVRLGTAVGFLRNEPVDTSALGLSTAFGHRFGRLAIESELDLLALQARSTGFRVGDAERLGVLGRVELVRLDSNYVGENSLLALYVELGAAVAWNHWDAAALDQLMRAVPPDTKRIEGQGGFGLDFDHRLEKPTGFPHRIGWFLGWRVAMSPRDRDSSTVCRGEISCRVALPAGPDDRYVQRSLLFQSSLSATW